MMKYKNLMDVELANFQLMNGGTGQEHVLNENGGIVYDDEGKPVMRTVMYWSLIATFRTEDGDTINIDLHQQMLPGEQTQEVIESIFDYLEAELSTLVSGKVSKK
jgi:hypothetical protein